MTKKVWLVTICFILSEKSRYIPCEDRCFSQCAYRRETAYENSKKLQQCSAEWKKPDGKQLFTVTECTEQKQQRKAAEPQRTAVERIAKEEYRISQRDPGHGGYAEVVL